MLDNKPRGFTGEEPSGEPAPRAARPGFLHSVGARLTAMGLWKGMAALLALLLLGAGAVAFHEGTRAKAAVAASDGVVLTKLVGLQQLHAAQATFHFNFTDVVHPGFWLFTGEKIQVTGTGTDDAIVNFRGLTRKELFREGPTSVAIVLRTPVLGTPQVNLQRTTLSESGGLFTHLSHLADSDPQDASEALADAQARIADSAAQSQLISQGEASTQAFLASLLGQLGFHHVTVTFI
jgi:hypothetical protein